MAGRLELATRLPTDTRVLAELLAERLDLASGYARVELELEDGKLVSVWLMAARADRGQASLARR